MRRYRLADAAATERFGACLAESCAPEDALTMHLRGELGAGKTTLTRGLLRRWGHRGAVKSPTYTIVEPYELGGRRVFHFDLYRLGDPEELEYLGFRDYLEEKAVCLIEWPERGAGALPEPDLEVRLAQPEGEGGRTAEVLARGARGRRMVERLEAAVRRRLPDALES